MALEVGLEPTNHLLNRQIPYHLATLVFWERRWESNPQSRAYEARWKPFLPAVKQF